MSPASKEPFNLGVIDQAYGADADLYLDVLRVSCVAPPSEIQEAFFARRNELYATLANLEDDDGGGDESNQRVFTEQRMDAVVTAFRILDDMETRMYYDESRPERLQRRAQNGQDNEKASLERAHKYSKTPRLRLGIDRDVHNVHSDEMMRVLPQSSATAVTPSPPPTRQKEGHTEKAKRRQARAAAIFKSRRKPEDTPLPPPPIKRDSRPIPVSHEKHKPTKSSRHHHHHSSHRHRDNEEPTIRSEEDHIPRDAHKRSIRKASSDDGVPRSSSKSNRRHSHSGGGRPKSSRRARRDDTDDSPNRSSDDVHVPRDARRRSERRTTSSDDGVLTTRSTGPQSLMKSITEEVHGAVDDTISAFDQVMHAFTLDERDIAAVSGQIQRAKRQLGS